MVNSDREFKFERENMENDEDVEYTWLAKLPAKVHGKCRTSFIGSERSSSSSAVSSPLDFHSGKSGDSDDLNFADKDEIDRSFESKDLECVLRAKTRMDLDEEVDGLVSRLESNLNYDRSTPDLETCASSVENLENVGQPKSGSTHVAENYDEFISTTLSKPQASEGEEQDMEQSTKDKDEVKLSKQDKMLYNDLVCKARDCESQGNLAEAIQYYTEAQNIHDSNGKLERKISKLQTLMTIRRKSIMQRKSSLPTDKNTIAKGWGYNNDSQVFFVQSQPSFLLNREAFEILLPYQRDGVAWLCDLHFRACGGILGDDMGLGKTCQTVTFLNGLFQSDLAKRVLIVAPVPVIAVWEREIAKFAPSLVSKVRLFHGTKVKERNQNLSEVGRRGGICLTSYGLGANHAETLAEVAWDYMICDEGHRLKNPSIQLSRRLRTVTARHRLLLTGTPLQNGLEELRALFDFAVPGLLGDRSTFRDRFVRPVVEANDRHADPRQRALGAARARELRERVAMFHLARSKTQALADPDQDPDSQHAETAAEPESRGIGPGVEKREWIVWVGLAAAQLAVYKAFLKSDRVREALNTTRSPLAAITVLKKICDHPLLLPSAPSSQASTDPSSSGPDPQLQALLEDCRPAADAGAGAWAAGSGKLALLLRLLGDLEGTGHRTLVFSQSARMLGMVARCLRAAGTRFVRMDGSTKLAERQAIVDLFQSDDSIPVFLLTTGVGGVGLTLTAADRVVVYDPSWNPAVDAQALEPTRP